MRANIFVFIHDRKVTFKHTKLHSPKFPIIPNWPTLANSTFNVSQ